MGYVLVKFDGNWADEMDLEGHMVMTDEEHENFREAISLVFDGFSEGMRGRNECVEFCVGTNESLMYAEEKEFLQDLSWVAIDSLQRNELRNMNLLSRGFIEGIYTQILDQAEEIRNT